MDLRRSKRYKKIAIARRLRRWWRAARGAFLIVQPDVVSFRDICQPVDGIQNLCHAPLVFLQHGGQQIHCLRQRFMALGEFFEAFVNVHKAYPEVDFIIAVGASRDVFSFMEHL